MHGLVLIVRMKKSRRRCGYCIQMPCAPSDADMDWCEALLLTFMSHFRGVQAPLSSC